METETQQIHSGSGDNIGKDKIVHIYNKATDYKELESQLNELKTQQAKLQRHIAKYPDDKDFRIELQKIVADIDQQASKIESFKTDVLRLYENITKIEINTERLRLAKVHFDKGELREADAILKAEEISQEVDLLKQAKSKKESELAEININLESKAYEFLIKSQLWKTFYSDPDWFEKACEYFEKALDSSHSNEIVFEYARFLQDHNQFKRAQVLNEEALRIRRSLVKENPRKYLPYVANALNNLAISQKGNNEPKQALVNYEEALEIARSLAEEKPNTYLPDVARTLNNLGIVKQDLRECGKALRNYKEALGIYKALAKESPKLYLPFVATTLNNLGVLQKEEKEFEQALANHKEALQINRILAEENPKTYLSDLATTLNNLGILQKEIKDPKEALGNYKEALRIRRTLAEENPRMYLPYLATTLNNLANLQREEKDPEKALAFHQEALQIYIALDDENPRTYIPELAATAYNLCTFYLECGPDKEKSSSLARYVIEIARKFPDHYMLQQYSKSADQVLQSIRYMN